MKMDQRGAGNDEITSARVIRIEKLLHKERSAFCRKEEESSVSNNNSDKIRSVNFTQNLKLYEEPRLVIK
jgi:hypothetical protein